MGKTDMSYYKDLLAGIAGAKIGAKVFKDKGGSQIIGAGLGSQALREAATKILKPIKKKKGGKVK